MTALNLQAQFSVGYPPNRSKTVGELIMQVALQRSDGVVSSGNPIEYGWLAITNKGCMVNLPKDEFFCCAKMFGPDGKNIPLQSSFENLWKRFFDLKFPSGELPITAIEEMLRIRPAHGTQAAAGDVMFAGKEKTEGRSFYSLENIFQMKEPGQYKVSMQFQAYERIYKGGQTFVYKLDRFEPFEFTVTKK